ncbi:ribonuclease H-like domain-containing protein [Tanacetum coccineum]|uniref:Ribonuclease H-like domain-containing protein n=1 Tax=Tanacetum coccineum TaxID=301880 RepID=A0ABQ5IXB7_9ASTR
MSGDDVNKHDDIGTSSNLNMSFGNIFYLRPNDTGGSPIITNTITDDKNLALANQWDMCNLVVVTWILNSSSPDLFVGSIYDNTAYEMWSDLKETYDKVDGSVVFNLHKNINSLNQNDASLAEYYNNQSSLWKHYLAIRSNILTREALPLVKEAFAVVSGEESHRNATSVGATKPTATTFTARAFDNKKMFNANNNIGFGSNSNFNNRGPNPNLKCTNCNNIGHTFDRCFELVGYPVVSSNNATTSNSPVSLSNEQLARLMSLLNDNGVSTANANMAGWIVDSGANQHMIVSAKFLINVVDISNLGLTVGHPNGTQALITKIGDLKINNDITLYNVLVVPEYTFSLLSVHKLATDRNNWLYFFDVDNASNIFSNNCIASCFVSNTLWHQRLGHPIDQVLDVLKTALYLDSHSTFDHLCDTCNKAKQTREAFPLRYHKLTKIRQLGNDNSEATSIEENNTQPKGDVSDEIDFVFHFYENSEFNSEVEDLPINTIRRSSRQTKLPTSLNDFIIDGKVKHDIDAMNAKIEALNKNHTWIITDLPANRKPISKWIFKIKYKANGEIERYKARLVCKLVESLYGLKQAPRKWNEKLVGVLKDNGFVQSANDHSLFTKSKDNNFIALLVYVDDIVLLKEYGLLGCEPVSTHMEPNSVLPYVATSDDFLLDNITACEIIWIQKLFFDLKTKVTRPDDLFCDNKSALQLAVNPVFHERHVLYFIEDLLIDDYSSHDGLDSSLSEVIQWLREDKMEVEGGEKK